MSKGVVVVLSGGGARGLAHVGLLKVLEDEGVRIRAIVGSSIGALIGALYASCADAQRLERFVTGLPLYRLPDITFSGQGLVGGARLHKVLRQFMRAERFEDLRIPLIVNATDLHSGEEVVFREGELLPALHASSAFPGVIRPLRQGSRLLVDGGVSHTVPVHLAPGRSPLLVSDVTGPTPLKARPRLFSVMRQSVHILLKNAVEADLERLKRPFVRVRPDVLTWEVFSLRDAEELVRRGELGMRASLPALRRML